jgi:hypothetical protein
LIRALSAAATPTPYPGYSGNPNLITPGWIGFSVIFIVAVATVFLLIDMTRRIRRSRYREDVRLQIEAEQAEAEAAAEAEQRRIQRGGRPSAGPDIR